MSFAQKVLCSWFGLASLFIGWACVEQAIYYQTKYRVAMAIMKGYEGRMSRLEYLETFSREEYELCKARVDELQSWRIDVTLASRMGWGQAIRYIYEYPLSLPVREVYNANQER